MRAWLFSTGEHSHTFLFLVHHIAADGWSMGPLATDLATAYEARRRGSAPVWTPLPVQYVDYAVWQREVVASVSDDQLSYWASALRDLPSPATLPSDHPRPEVPSRRSAGVPVRFSAAAHERLLALARSSGATLFMVLQAGLAALLTRLGAGTDIPIGTPVAGRTDEALDDLVGCFANVLVLRTDTSGSPTFGELLERVRHTDLAAFAHQDVPYEQHQAPFQVGLSLRNTPRASREVSGLEVRPDRVDVANTDCDLFLELWDSEDDGINGTVEYAVDLYTEETVRSFVSGYLELLAGVELSLRPCELG